MTPWALATDLIFLERMDGEPACKVQCIHRSEEGTFDPVLSSWACFLEEVTFLNLDTNGAYLLTEVWRQAVSGAVHDLSSATEDPGPSSASPLSSQRTHHLTVAVSQLVVAAPHLTPVAKQKSSSKQTFPPMVSLAQKCTM